MTDTSTDPDAIQQAMKQSAAVLNRADVPFALAGGLACWARGAGPSFHDVDYIVLPDDADRALEALADAGFRTERPPEEQWLFKAYGARNEMIDLIFEPSGPSSKEILADADVMEVLGLRIPVMTPTHVLVAKLCALTELHLGYTSILQVARPLREQIDWKAARKATDHSPFARAFFTMAEGLDIAPS